MAERQISTAVENIPTPTKKQLWVDLLRLSWPVVIELTLASLIGIATMALVSSIGKEAVSAVGITNQPIMIPWVAIQAFSVGGMALVGRAMGMNDFNLARKACEQTMLLAVIFSIISGALLYIWGGHIVLWMGATPDYFYMAEIYMRYSAIGVVFQSISMAVASMMRSVGRTRLSMYFSIVANVTNVLLGLILIHGLGPIPAMGIVGAGIAQLISRVIGCVFALAMLFSIHELPICPDWRGILKPDWGVIKRICRVGTGSALEQLTLRVGLIAFTIYVIRLGTAEYAAHNIATTIHNFVVNFGQSIGIALVSVVGLNLGAKRPDIANMYFNTAIKMSILSSIILIIPLLLLPYQIAAIFTREPLVVQNIVIALQILALFTTAQIVQMAIAGGLRGGGDTRWPLISTMAGVLGMRMILGYIFIIMMGWGIAGAWLCWLLDQTVRAIIIYFRYRGGKWKTVRV